MSELIRRSNNYFADKILKEDKHIYSDDLDSQFNQIGKYLIDVIKPSIEELVKEAAKGVAGNIGAFLHNIGDGSTDWRQLDSNKIDDGIITYDKLMKQHAGSVLVSNDAGEIESLTPVNTNEVIISQAGTMPKWSKITAENIEDKTLTGQQLGLLSVENFAENQFVTDIVPNVIGTNNIKDLNITGSKLLDGSITLDKLGIFSNLPTVPTHMLKAENIDDGALSPEKIKDNSIPVTDNGNKSVKGHLMDIWGNVYGQTTVAGGYVYKQILKSEHIKDDSIDDSLLTEIETPRDDDTKERKKQKAQAFFKDVPLTFQLQSRHIANNSLDESCFDKEVQNAIARL